LAIPAQEAGTANSQAPGTQTISIDFRGGSLEQFVDAICRAGKNINILLSSAGSKINLPPMKLHNAGVEAALQAAGQIVTSDYRIQVRPYHSGVGEPVYSVAVQEISQVVTQAGFAPSSRQVRVFSLKVITEPIPAAGDAPGSHIKVETVLTAIDTGLSVLSTERADPAAKVRFHVDSGLLFVEGNAAQLSLVEQVLSNLTNDVRRMQIEAAAARTAPATKAGDEKKSHQ
jgi:hypothetical protein